MTGKEYLDIEKDTKGIYLFKNILDGKCYVGQSLNIRQRFNRHMRRMQNKWNYPIYNALNKYGLENFEFSILETTNIEDKEKVIKWLNEKEIYYVALYKAYEEGYNLTIGGESISGYKFSEEACKKISEGAKKVNRDGRNKFYAYNIESKTYEEYLTLYDFNNKYGYTSRHIADKKLTIVDGKWIGARNKEDLERKIKECEEYQGNLASRGQFITKDILTTEIIQDLKTLSKDDFMNKYKICKGTYYNYLRKAGIKTLTSQGKDPRAKCTKEQFLKDYPNLSRDELCSKYNLSIRRYNELEEKYFS